MRLRLRSQQEAIVWRPARPIASRLSGSCSNDTGVGECNVIVKRDKQSVLLLRQKMRHRAVDVADQGVPQAIASTTLQDRV